MPASFTTRQAWALIALAVFSAAIVITSLSLVRDLLTTNRLITNALEIEKETQQALICLMDCETAYRGFLVTGKDEYLQPYEHCYRAVASHIVKVGELTKDNQKQQKMVPIMLDLAQKEIRFAQSVIEGRRKDPVSPGRVVADLTPGKELMDQFRACIAAVLHEEQDLLDKRVKSFDDLQYRVFGAVSGLTVCIVASMIWIALNSQRFAAAQALAKARLTSAVDEAVEARNEAIQANKLKSQFVANISHEIRTPLSGIIGISELMVDYSDSDPETKEMASHVLDAARGLLAIVNDLLDFSKLEAGKLGLNVRKFSILDVIDDATKSVELAAQAKNLKLVKDIDAVLPSQVCGDPDRLRQVILNLVHNAIKFTEIGSVTISAHQQKAIDNQIFVRFEVTDTGIGISEADRANLFEPFVQVDGDTNRKYGGTGLGLSICKNIVHVMSGAIGCESKNGGGATFWFTVPFETGATTKCDQSQ